MKRLIIFLLLLLPLTVNAQTKTVNNLKVVGKTQIGDTILIDSAKVVSDTLNIWYSTGELTGWKTNLKNIKVRGWIKFGTNGSAIDSIKLESDTLRFYVGATKYSFVKAVKNE
ncbi:MAG: hypothetical protein WC428_07600 [Candidatus Paceibacterota bacterium]